RHRRCRAPRRRGRPGRAAARSPGHPRPAHGLSRRRRHPGVAGRGRDRHRADRRLPGRMSAVGPGPDAAPAGVSPGTVSGGPGSAIAVPPAATVSADVERALAEDIGGGDGTAALLPDAPESAYLLCKEDAVVCGRPWFDACHRALDPDVAIDWRVAEGDHVRAGTVL